MAIQPLMATAYTLCCIGRPVKIIKVVRAVVDAGEKELGPNGHTSDVVGSMTVLTSEIRLAGNPPCLACSRTISSLGAI